MSLHSVVDAVMQSITDLNDDWYELPEQIIEDIPDEVEIEESMKPCTKNCVGSSLAQERKDSSKDLQSTKETYIVETVRCFIRYVYYAHSLLLKSAGFTSGSICPYDLDPTHIKMELRRIMDQCRRLRDEPQMFPSVLLEDKFLTTMAVLAEAMLSIEKARAKLLEFKEQVYSPVIDMRQPYSDLLLPTPVIYPMPAFLPDKLHGKHPWNNWLDNSAQSAAGWVAIQQKIPKVGEKLMRKIVLLYEVVQEQFDEDADPNLSPEYSDEIPAPGDSFRHMTWSGFCTLPSYNLGFKSGKRKGYDFHGIKTAEHLSNTLCSLYDGAGVRLGTDNCPYFRFAMAYAKH